MSGAQRVSDLIKRSPSITIIADLRYVTNWRASKIGRSNSRQTSRRRYRETTRRRGRWEGRRIPEKGRERRDAADARLIARHDGNIRAAAVAAPAPSRCSLTPKGVPLPYCAFTRALVIRSAPRCCSSHPPPASTYRPSPGRLSTTPPSTAFATAPLSLSPSLSLPPPLPPPLPSPPLPPLPPPPPPPPPTSYPGLYPLSLVSRYLQRLKGQNSRDLPLRSSRPENSPFSHDRVLRPLSSKRGIGVSKQQLGCCVRQVGVNVSEGGNLPSFSRSFNDDGDPSTKESSPWFRSTRETGWRAWERVWEGKATSRDERKSGVRGSIVGEEVVYRG